MSYNIIATPRFKREIKRLAKKFLSLKAEYAKLLNDLEVTPTIGTPLGNNCFKIRLSINSKGKGRSGGARVITYVLIKDTTVFLVSIYDKSEQANITDKEILKLLREINA